LSQQPPKRGVVMDQYSGASPTAPDITQAPQTPRNVNLFPRCIGRLAGLVRVGAL